MYPRAYISTAGFAMLKASGKSLYNLGWRRLGNESRDGNCTDFGTELPSKEDYLALVPCEMELKAKGDRYVIRNLRVFSVLVRIVFPGLYTGMHMWFCCQIS